MTSHLGTTRDLLIEPLRARWLKVGAEVLGAFARERAGGGVAVPDSFPRASTLRTQPRYDSNSRR